LQVLLRLGLAESDRTNDYHLSNLDDQTPQNYSVLGDMRLAPVQIDAAVCRDGVHTQRVVVHLTAAHNLSVIAFACRVTARSLADKTPVVPVVQSHNYFSLVCCPFFPHCLRNLSIS
jgi:hypothetical protein